MQGYQKILTCFGVAVFPFLFKRSRHYVYSWIFPYLYDQPKLSAALGIKYVNDTEFIPTRENTSIYLDGVFAFLFRQITELPIPTPESTRKELLRLQGLCAKNISMEPYFDEILDKRMSLSEFESKLSSCILVETNRVFEILTVDEERRIYNELEIIRVILSGLTGGENKSIKSIITGLFHVRKIMNILREKTPAQRLLILIPHLSLIEGFSKMVVKKRQCMENLEMKDFFDYTSRFFVVTHNGELTFINRAPDDKNTENNRAFGISPGFLCPGSIYVAKFIKSILEFLKCLDITVEGDANISNARFRIITNKDEIFVTFKKSSIRMYNDENTN